MNTDPAPETTLSAEDAVKVEVFANPYARGLGWNRAEIARIIRDLDAKLVAARKEELRLIECCKSLNREKNERNDASLMNYDRFVKSQAENAALTERLRVAENRLLTAREGWDAMKVAQRDAINAWNQVDNALAPTSDAAPKEAT